MKTRRTPLLDALEAMDAAMASRGYMPRKMQPAPDDVRVRLYKNKDTDHGISLAVTHEEIMLPRRDFNWMLAMRIKRAFANEVAGTPPSRS